MRGLDKWIEGDPGAMFYEDERRAFAEAPTLNDLIDEYADWQQQHDLKLGSADEHIFDETLADWQRTWLRDFCCRWEEAERRERHA